MDPEPTPPLNQPPAVPPEDTITPDQPHQPVVLHVPHKSKKKYWLIGLGIFVVVLVAGFVFGYYLPNKPTNAYKTGISRTGYALDKLLSSTTEQKSLDSLKKSDISLAINAKYNEASYDGNFDMAFDTSKLSAQLKIATSDNGQNKQIVDAHLLGELPEGSQYPNLYLQLNGLKSLDIDNFVPGASVYDGQWIAITSDYLKSLGNVPTAAEANKKAINSQDISELSKTLIKVSREYVFSNDPSRAVFENKAFLGKEKVDNLTAFHYQVTLNHEHLTAYCQATADAVYATNAYKKLPWVNQDTLEKDKQSAKSACQNSVKNIDPATTYDLWVEAKYKLIYKYRVTQSKSRNAYTEIGQIYRGGSVFNFFTNYHDGQNNLDSKMNLVTDFKTNSTQGLVGIDGGKAGSRYSVKLTLNAKPHEGNIDVQKPVKTVPVDEVLQKLGINETLR